MIGMQGKRIETEKLPASNLVFLIDVSGSMDDENKLPLVKESLHLLVNQLRPQDRIAIVVYAGAAGEVLPSTSGSDKATILAAIDNLQAGGSTAGGAGIELAYSIAQKNFLTGGNNRVILATDGDFNVGASSDAELFKLIEDKRKTGVFITCLGYGMGNYKDDMLEGIADKGNGNYAYIDNVNEAKKTLVKEMGGTLVPIAKDVKLQLEFNPTKVQAYRLVGYENRLLAAEDFADDTKDAGELGMGHTVTAFYEIIPVGIESEFVKPITPLKYQETTTSKTATQSTDLMTIKFRYKRPQGNKSVEMVQAVAFNPQPLDQTSNNFRFASSVALFAMQLNNSKFTKQTNWDTVLLLAKNAIGEDKENYRKDFVQLVEKAKQLKP
jgi:Ca-activated chloride channel family protein